jgi:hypothetical protein
MIRGVIGVNCYKSFDVRGYGLYILLVISFGVMFYGCYLRV